MCEMEGVQLQIYCTAKVLKFVEWWFTYILLWERFLNIILKMHSEHHKDPDTR
jgi:hypothetical protein